MNQKTITNNKFKHFRNKLVNIKRRILMNIKQKGNNLKPVENNNKIKQTSFKFKFKS